MTEEEDVVVTVRGIRATLSPEQVAVMQQLVVGCSYREAGAKLGLSRTGVKKRVYSVCDAIGARNRIEALALLLQEGILQIKLGP